MKVMLIIIGIILILIGLFFSFGILLYAKKESDDQASYFVVIPISIIITGIIILRKGILLKRNA